MRNNRLYALMLMHVHMIILDSINLANAMHDSVDRKDSRKQTFRYFFSELYIVYMELSEHLGAFHIFIFPIKCYNVELCTLLPFAI